MSKGGLALSLAMVDIVSVFIQPELIVVVVLDVAALVSSGGSVGVEEREETSKMKWGAKCICCTFSHFIWAAHIRSH
jgi:hypothetical protein